MVVDTHAEKEGMKSHTRSAKYSEKASIFRGISNQYLDKEFMFEKVTGK